MELFEKRLRLQAEIVIISFREFDQSWDSAFGLNEIGDIWEVLTRVLRHSLKVESNPFPRVVPR